MRIERHEIPDESNSDGDEVHHMRGPPDPRVAESAVCELGLPLPTRLVEGQTQHPDIAREITHHAAHRGFSHSGCVGRGGEAG